eukprot:GFUD01028273.1.p1 GENE.GFUD01028273.1~~GFUD01028273.1.p1  ORF type:complete len:276 (-),score=79.62 GFUD01028273.1:60-887(-)
MELELIARRITRETLKSVVEESSASRMLKKRKTKKKVVFEENSTTEGESKKNLSLVSDEGIDMNFLPLTPSLTIHYNIIKPQHPLPHSWTFWYSAGDKKLSWKKNQVKISTVATVEEFWHTVNQVQPASCLPAGYTYSVFRVGIIPDWEDVHNRDGGRWMVGFPKAEAQGKLDKRWMEILFMLMGEQVQEEGAKLVTGAEVCVRKKGDRLEVWVEDANNMRGLVDVGREMKRKLMLGRSEMLQFSVHKEERECSGVNNSWKMGYPCHDVGSSLLL